MSVADVDPIPLVGGGAAVVLVGILASIIGRFVKGWLDVILRERTELGGSYQDILKLRAEEILVLKDERAEDRRLHAEEIHSLEERYNEKLAEFERQLEIEHHRVSLAEESERECLKLQTELLKEIRDCRQDQDDLRAELTATLAKLPAGEQV